MDSAPHSPEPVLIEPSANQSHRISLDMLERPKRAESDPPELQNVRLQNDGMKACQNKLKEGRLKTWANQSADEQRVESKLVQSLHFKKTFRLRQQPLYQVLPTFDQLDMVSMKARMSGGTSTASSYAILGGHSLTASAAKRNGGVLRVTITFADPVTNSSEIAEMTAISGSPTLSCSLKRVLVKFQVSEEGLEFSGKTAFSSAVETSCSRHNRI
ncbi:hypothetical protein DFH09DRAFT_1280992 [Mycena vulgaris]|nr:hypothetical protein DFH09DRAFT_1280992 [Mycena vulgaris]